MVLPIRGFVVSGNTKYVLPGIWLLLFNVPFVRGTLKFQAAVAPMLWLLEHAMGEHTSLYSWVLLLIGLTCF